MSACPLIRPDCATESGRATSAGVFFVPLNILIAATSVLAFVGSDDCIDEDDDFFPSICDYINTLVGCLAAVSVFLNSCDRLLNYKSRADMHTAAKLVCKELLTEIEFTLIKYATPSKEALDGRPVNDDDQVLFDDIKTKFQQVQESCTSSVPEPINQAFTKMLHLVIFDLDLDPLGVDPGDTEAGQMYTLRSTQVVRIAMIILCDEITKSWVWPMKLPGAKIFQSASDSARNDIMEKVRAKAKEHEARKAAKAAKA